MTKYRIVKRIEGESTLYGLQYRRFLRWRYYTTVTGAGYSSWDVPMLLETEDAIIESFLLTINRRYFVTRRYADVKETHHSMST